MARGVLLTETGKGHYLMKNAILATLLGTALLTAPALRADDRRVYDRDHRDYHAWNSNEDRAYRHWLTEERHERYRRINRLRAEDRRAYWQWRHEHRDWR